MNEFYRGMLTLPIAATAVGVASIAVLGGWVSAEHWAERRWVRIGDPVITEHRGTAYVHPHGRNEAAALVALAPTVRRIKLGFGTQLVLTRGTQRISRADHRAMSRQIRDAYPTAESGASA